MFRRSPEDQARTAVLLVVLGIVAYFAITVVDLWADKQRHDQTEKDVEKTIKIIRSIKN